MAKAVTQQLDWGMMLRDHGLRVTQPRIAVMHALWRHPHSSADQIVRHAQRRVASLSVQSVYNVLSDLTAHRLVRSIELPHQPGLYELDAHDNHHHAICTRCGLVADVECAVGTSPCLTPSSDHGITIEIADVLYRGLCSSCRQATTKSTTQQKTATSHNPTGDEND